MKKLIKGLSLLLTVALLCTVPVQLLPAAALEYGDFSYSVEKDTNYVTIDAYNGSAANVTIPSVIDSNPVKTIGYRAFAGNETLVTVTVPDSVTYIADRAFYACEALTTINIGASNTAYAIYNGGLYDKSKTTLVTYPPARAGTTYVLPANTVDVTPCAFAFSKNLTGIYIAATNGNYTTVDGVLFNKNQTTLISYPGGKSGAYTVPSTVSSITQCAFAGASLLTAVTLPSTITVIRERTFADCVRLSACDIPSNVTTIEEYAFRGTGLVDVVLPSSVTSIGNFAYALCPYLEAFTVPNGFTTVNIGVFYGCANLSSFVFPSSLTTIYDNAFYGTGFSALSIPSTVTTLSTYAFGGCANLASVVLPSGMTSIPEGFLSDCPALETIFIPASVTAMSVGALANCAALKTVNFGGTKAQWGGITFANNVEVLANCKINCNAVACQHNYVTVVTMATCTTGGYLTHSCTLCGDTYNDSFSAALGHALVTDVAAVDVTCTAAGCTEGVHCTRCDYAVVSATIPALGHAYTSSTVAPTCTAGGYSLNVCTRCLNTTRTNQVSALGHDYVSVVTAPTTTAGGYTTHTCTRCSDSYVDSLTDPLPTTEPTAVNLQLTDSLAIGADGIALKVLLDADDIPSGAGNLYATFSYMNPVTGVRTTATTISPTLDGDCYSFVYEKLKQTELGSTCYLCVYYTSGGTSYISQEHSTSVASAAQTMLASSSTSALCKTLLVDYLRCGAAAQTYYGVGTNALADANIGAYSALGTSKKVYLADVTAYVAGTTGAELNATADISDGGTVIYTVSKTALSAQMTSMGITGASPAMFLRVMNQATGAYTDLTDDGTDADDYRFVCPLSPATTGDVLYATVFADGMAVTKARIYSLESYLAVLAQSGTNAAAYARACRTYANALSAYLG